MPISDLIQIAAILVSLLTSCVAICVSIKDLRLNREMIEESSRPYISLYLESITICEQASFFIIKNFGNSAARIDSFEYDPALTETIQKAPQLIDQLNYIDGIFLAPGQSKLLEYDVTSLQKDFLTFKITYSSSLKQYEEVIHLNVKNYIHIPVSRPGSHIIKNDERKVHTLREILEHLI